MYSTDETGFVLDCEGSFPFHRANFAQEETVTFRKADLRHCIYKCKIFDICQEFCSQLDLIAIFTGV